MMSICILCMHKTACTIKVNLYINSTISTLNIFQGNLILSLEKTVNLEFLEKVKY